MSHDTAKMSHLWQGIDRTLTIKYIRRWCTHSVGVLRDVGCRALVVYAANSFSAQYIFSSEPVPHFLLSNRVREEPQTTLAVGQRLPAEQRESWALEGLRRHDEPRARAQPRDAPLQRRSQLWREAGGRAEDHVRRIGPRRVLGEGVAALEGNALRSQGGAVDGLERAPRRERRLMQSRLDLDPGRSLVSRTSMLSLRPAGSPEASVSAGSRIRLLQGRASPGQSATWAAALVRHTGLGFDMGRRRQRVQRRRSQHGLACAAAKVKEYLARHGLHPLETAREGRRAHLAVLYAVAKDARGTLRRLLLACKCVAVDRGVGGREVGERVGVQL